MTQWEELKKEYKEITIPEGGAEKLQAVMEEAKRKRCRRKTRTGYGTMVAAALLLLLLVPGNMFLSGGAAKESCNDAVVQGAGRFNGNIAPESAMPEMPAYQADCEYSMNGSWKETTSEEELNDVISREILSQMELRMKETKEIYYVKSEHYPNGFERLEDDQEYYINEDGLLVIVFLAGTVAPEEQGSVEFVIPAGVFLP